MKILSLILSLLSIFCISWFFFWKQSDEICKVPSLSGDWTLEIVRTPASQAKGLMYRKDLCERCGMLFVFSDERPRIFWMKHTLIPLDMYFYDAGGKLVDTAYNMRPEHEMQTPMIYRSQPAKYVLEVNSDIHFDSKIIHNCAF